MNTTAEPGEEQGTHGKGIELCYVQTAGRPLLKLLASVKYPFNFKAHLTPFHCFLFGPMVQNSLCVLHQLHQEIS